MNRLTKKNSVGCYPQYEREKKTNYHDLIYKLGQLEDIEEELGIYLLTLFKALKYGIYYFNKLYKEIYFSSVSLEKKWENYSFILKSWGSEHEKFELNDYGKKWALTEKELENDSSV